MKAHPGKALAIGLAALGLAFGASAQKSDLPRGDVKFMQKAAAGGLAEVELGKLAQQKAVRQEVKEFAALMVADHGKANADLQKIASAHGVALPAGLDKKQQKEMDKLSQKVGPEFDRDYMKHMLKDHKKDVKEFREHAKSRKPNDVTAFAAETLPTLQVHLRSAQATNDIVQASKRTGERATGSTKQ